jgi:3-deoxy-D-manno-octulosonic-acid transferase
MWILYEALLLMGLLLYIPRALWRRRLPHRGWTMRLGRYPEDLLDRLQGRQAIWLHAVSVGEVLAAQPLLRALQQRYPKELLVVSVITPGGFEVASRHATEGIASLYVPLDFRWCVSRALDTIRPRILLLMEAELWPTVVRLTKARNVPIAVVNGRISPRAFGRYQCVKPWLRGTLNRIDCYLMQTQTDADRIIQLGAAPSNVKVVGSLKWDASIGSRPSPEAIRALGERLGLTAAPLVVAGSTHRGEETAALRAFQAVRATRPEARLIIAPRHLERLAEVEALIRHAGFSSARLSQTTAGGGWDVGLVDTFGRLPQYYGLASVVFIGGSLIPHGGQNPLEAASLGHPIVFGPSMYNFEAIAHQLLAHRAARQIRSADELTAVLLELCANPTQAQLMGRRAQELTEQFQGATQRTLQAIATLLPAAWPKGYG